MTWIKQVFQGLFPGNQLTTLFQSPEIRSAVRQAVREIEVVARRYCPTATVTSRQGATPDHLSFRIAVYTDRQRDQLRKEPMLYQQLHDALVRVGYPPDSVPSVHFRIESQETVDREYGGSWHEESEMP
jgi:hypothetical protein